MEDIPLPEADVFRSAIHASMPFGKYKNKHLPQIPISYFEWFARKGFPPGKLGMQMQTIYEVKLNGLEYMFEIFK